MSVPLNCVIGEKTDALVTSRRQAAHSSRVPPITLILTTTSRTQIQTFNRDHTLLSTGLGTKTPPIIVLRNDANSFTCSDGEFVGESRDECAFD